MSLVPVPGGVPEQIAQLLTGAPTKGSDCNIATVYLAIAFASDGRVTIAPDRPAAIAQIRRWMDKPSGATTIKDAFRALSHPELRRLFTDAGLQPPKPTSRRGVRWERIESDLREGAFVDLHVNYGVLRDGKKVPTWSRTFRGGHAIALLGYLPLLGTTNEADPLATRWSRVPLSAFRDAAGRYGKRPWGVGKAEALSIKRAKPVADGRLAALRKAVDLSISGLDKAAEEQDKAVTLLVDARKRAAS